MKYVVVLGDGMADEPTPALGGKTPLEKAETPNLDRVSKMAEVGMVHTIPDGMKPGSDTANLSVLGYDPKKYYSGRSPLEALSIGVDMKDTDVPQELREEMKQLFELADFVKFAKFTASDDDNAKALPTAVRFVTSTYQSDIEEADSTADNVTAEDAPAVEPKGESVQEMEEK